MPIFMPSVTISVCVGVRGKLGTAWQIRGKVNTRKQGRHQAQKSLKTYFSKSTDSDLHTTCPTHLAFRASSFLVVLDEGLVAFILCNRDGELPPSTLTHKNEQQYCRHIRKYNRTVQNIKFSVENLFCVTHHISINICPDHRHSNCTISKLKT